MARTANEYKYSKQTTDVTTLLTVVILIFNFMHYKYQTHGCQLPTMFGWRHYSTYCVSAVYLSVSMYYCLLYIILTDVAVPIDMLQ